VIDLSFKNNKEPEGGTLLISDPFLDEAYFRRSVILLCEHSENASFGLVLNNFLDVDLHELDHDFPDIHARISVGGPVETQSLYYIHSFSNIEDSFEVRDGLYFGGSFSQLKSLIEESPSNGAKIRFFLGYSGWDRGQLANEILEHSWIVVDNISNKEILGTLDDNFWQHCMEKQGKEFKTISRFPLNPNHN
jgi:putative transcriptional regulator